MLAPLFRTFAVVSWVNSFLLKPCLLSPRTGPMDRVPSVALKVSEWKPRPARWLHRVADRRLASHYDVDSVCFSTSLVVI